MTKKKTTIEIKHKVTGKVLYTFAGDSFAGVIFKDIDLRYADMRGLNLEGAVFKGTDLRYADMRDSNLEGAIFVKVNLQIALLIGANVKHTHFDTCDMFMVELQKADCYKAVFSFVNLKEAFLSGANFEGAQFRVVDLNSVFDDLSKAQLLYYKTENKWEIDPHFVAKTVPFERSPLNIVKDRRMESDLWDLGDERRMQLREANLSDVDLTEEHLSDQV